MTSPQEVVLQEQATKRNERIARAVDGGLERSVEHMGGELRGIAVKLNPVECLLVLKADFPAGAMVAFCASGSLADAVVKAVYEGQRDRLRWRPDKYAGPSGVAE